MSLSGNLTTGPNYKSHVDDKNNPHNVTCEQIGALQVNGWQAATDFNTLTETGVYQCQGVNLNTPYGSDSDTHFHVSVLKHSDEWVRQEAYDVRTQNCYTRVKVGGTWYGWQQIMLGSDVTTLLNGKANSNHNHLRILEGYQNYDLNTLTEGFRVYKCSGNSTNTPVSGKYGHLIVMQSSNETMYAVQLYVCELNGDGIWKRYQNNGNWTAWVRIIDSESIKGSTFKVASVTQSLTISNSYKNLGMHEVSDFVLTVPNSSSIVGISFMAVNCNIQYVHILDNGYQWDSGTDTLRVHAFWIGATNQQLTQTFECKVIYM